MKISSVTARAFGPLVNSTLEFADGLTVVHGPNESAKSSWHAAIYAALCGRRRRRGQPSPEEREFSRRHKPWDRDDWLVSTRLLLDDGRRVELRQDLSGTVDCDAVDLDLGRDCSAEIMHDDTPDGAIWLGLDRASFRATACVAQAQVLEVLDRADGLQNHLQRAASTAGAEETAAEARRRISEFRDRVVGSLRAPKRPLVRATEAVTAAQSRLRQARTDHDEYERRLLELDRLRIAAGVADQAVRRREAGEAADEARLARERLDSAAALSDRVADAPPSAPSPDLVTMVAEALAATAVDRAAEPTGPDDAQGLARAAGAEPRTAVDASEMASRAAHAAVLVADASGIELGEEELYGLARLLDHAPPTVDPRLTQRVAAARAEVAKVARVRKRWVGLIAAAGLALPLGVVLVLAGPLVVGLALAGLLLAAGAATLAVVAGFGLRSASAQAATARAALGGAELQEATGRAEAQAAQARRDQAVARATAAGLPADPAALRERARRSADRRGSELVAQRWRRDGQDRLLAAARAAGRPATSAVEAESGLRGWQREQADTAARRELHALDRRQLETVLAGETLDDLRRRVSTLDERAAVLAARVDLALASTVDSGVDDLAALRARAEAAGRAAHGTEVALGQWLAGVHPVGEAEEEFERAQAELARLRELDTTLDITEKFLARAEETAHRSIAPRLVQTVRAWLPAITGGRYTDVLVDPEKLEVRVRAEGGRWREAGRLSYGTAEQIYLVLRIALAEQLARPGVRCPLLLDDVTVHADADRTGQLLDLLLLAAADRQIILFTQQDEVVEWARTHLTEPRHAVIELAEVPAV
jgi:hypothetical protein